MTMKAHILHNFSTSTHRGELPPPPWRRHWLFLRKSKYVGSLRGPGTESDVYDCRDLILGQAWQRPPPQPLRVQGPRLICDATGLCSVFNVAGLQMIAPIKRTRKTPRVCVQLPASADNVALPVVAAARGAEAPAPLSIDITYPPGHSSKPAARCCLARMGQTDRPRGRTVITKTNTKMRHRASQALVLK